MAPVLQSTACSNAPHTRPVHVQPVWSVASGRRTLAARHGRLAGSAPPRKPSELAATRGAGSEASTSSSPPSQGEQPEASFSGRAEGGAGGGGASAGLATFAEVQAAATARGLALRLTQVGPFFSISCRQGGPGPRRLA